MTKQRLALLVLPLSLAWTICSFPACTDGAGVERRPDIFMDAHAHIASQQLLDTLDALGGPPSKYVPVTSARALIDSFLNVSGSQKAILLSSAYIWSSATLTAPDTSFVASPQEYANVRFENDFTAQQAAFFPDTLIAFCGVHPVKDYALAEIDRCADSLGMQGLKMQFSSSNVNLREPRQLARVKAVVQHAAGRGLPVVLHFANVNMDDFGREDMAIFIDEVLTQSPGLRLSFAHLTGAGSFPTSTRETFGLLIREYRRNAALQQCDLFTDVSAVFNPDSTGSVPGVDQADLDTIAHQLRAFGVERVFWGSDNNDGYVAPTDSMWPLDNAAYNRMATHGPERLLAAPPEAQ